MDHDLSRYPVFWQRILKNEDCKIGFFVTWFIALTILPTAGFYLGTIISPASNVGDVRHYWDLRIADMHYGGWCALIGLAIGCCWGLWMTFMYPVAKEREAALEAGHVPHHPGQHEEQSAETILEP